MTVSGQAHRYRAMPTPAGYDAMVAACADGANTYLAVPADQAELDALLTVEGDGNFLWVGIDDQTTENTYVPVTGGTFDVNSPLWESLEPDNSPRSGGGQGDCVSLARAGSGLGDDKCTNTYPAVCECEP
jgi:hypothetical protein